jgi:hypothetical protein
MSIVLGLTIALVIGSIVIGIATVVSMVRLEPRIKALEDYYAAKKAARLAQHSHPYRAEGCYRCEIAADEVKS